jgi:hypothetical protein
MAKKVESIPTVLGELRKGLIDQGYTTDQAFWIVQDLIRNGNSPTALIED